MLYKIAHLLREKFGWLWNLIEIFNSMLFAYRYGKKVKAGANLGIRKTFADVGATVADILGAEAPSIGESFKEVIL